MNNVETQLAKKERRIEINLSLAELLSSFGQP